MFDEKNSDSEGLLQYLLSTEAIFSLITFRKIFSILNPASKLLQSVDLDLAAAVNFVEQCKTDIANLRNDFDKICQEVEKFKSSSNYEQEFQN